MQIKQEMKKILSRLKFNVQRVGSFFHVAYGTREPSEDLMRDLEDLEKQIDNLLDLYEEAEAYARS